MRNASYLSPTSEEWASRGRASREMMVSCVLCPRNCRVRRIECELGVCRIGPDPVVSSYGPHFGEERPLVVSHGSGTIFFTGCNLRCTFCQNYEISQLCVGDTINPDQLAQIMIFLQDRGCHNINLVTPTHQLATIIDALSRAVALGLTLPIVYNSGGYDSVDALRLLDGIVVREPDQTSRGSTTGHGYSDSR